MLPVSGAEQLKAIGAAGGTAPHLLAEHPVLPVGEPGAVALVRHEQVPEPLSARRRADLDQDLRVGRARGDLRVERPHHLELDRVDVLVHEHAHPVAKLLDPRRDLEVHRPAD